MSDPRPPPYIPVMPGDLLRAADWNEVQRACRDDHAHLQQRVIALEGHLADLTALVENLRDRLAQAESVVIIDDGDDLDPNAPAQWLANTASRQVHHRDCPYGRLMGTANRLPTEGFIDASAVHDLLTNEGYDGCAHCMHAHHRD